MEMANQENKLLCVGSHTVARTMKGTDGVFPSQGITVKVGREGDVEAET